MTWDRIVPYQVMVETCAMDRHIAVAAFKRSGDSRNGDPA